MKVDLNTIQPNQININRLKQKKREKIGTNFSNSIAGREFYDTGIGSLYKLNFLGNGYKNTKREILNNIAGYEIQKNAINNAFITPIREEKAGHNSTVPNGIVIYGVSGTGKTTFAHAAASETNCKLIEINPTPQEFSKEVQEILNESRERYIQTGQRTVVLIENADIHFDENNRENWENIDLMKNWLDNCAKLPDEDTKNTYAATFFFTTDNPLNISEEILQEDKVSLILPIMPARGENIKQIIQFYMEENDPYKKYADWDNLDFSEIIKTLNPDSKKGAFGADKLKRMVDETYRELRINHGGDFSENLIKQSEKTIRNIRSEKLEKYQQDLHTLAETGLLPSVEITDTVVFGIDNIFNNLNNEARLNTSLNQLSVLEEENNLTLNSLSELLRTQDEQEKELLASGDIRIDGIVLMDFWLKEEKGEEAAARYNSRLKNMWFAGVLKDENKISQLITLTLNKLEESNAMIKTARDCYIDIIENEEDLSVEQKEILIRVQENELFYRIVTNKLSPYDIVEIEANTLSILEQLDSERQGVKDNAFENIFSKAENSAILSSNDSDDRENVSFIFDLLIQKAQNADYDEKIKLSKLITAFNNARIEGDKEEFSKIWGELLNEAIEYFENEKLEELTDRNIELLYSIQKKSSKCDNPIIKQLINNSSFTIEQKEFIARYADDDSFRAMIKNGNVDLHSIINDLVYFEAGNKSLVDNAGLEVSDGEFNRMMSDKFKQIDRDSKDINVQGNKIVSKLDEINSSINSQSDLINQFAENFSNYASTSLDMQNAQLNQLIEIGSSVSEIKQYTQAMTRAKLVELQKDKYYKDIVPEITKLLPEDEQIDIKDFLSKVDELAKKEKNALRKKKIIKAAVIIAAVAAAAAGAYFFGPAIVAHLASELPSNLAMQTMAQSAASAGIARKLGNSGLMNQTSFGNKAGDPPNWQRIKSELREQSSNGARDAARAIKKIDEVKGSGGITSKEVKDILDQFDIDIDV